MINENTMSPAFLTDWSLWWRELPAWRKWLPLPLLALYMLALQAVGGLRIDHWLLVSIFLFMLYGGRKLERTLKFFFPLILMAMIYDSQRHYSDYIRGPVHVRQPYEFDKRFFGIETPEGRLTPNEWFQKHTHPVLDILSGFAYLTYVAEFVVVAAWFYYRKSRTGTAKRAPEWVRAYTPRLMWAFFWVNIVGFSTYYWYAASPPWYTALYGLGPARFDVPANPAGAIRFDLALGTHFFTGMYGRSADVHGAIPSLHVAYPLMAVYYAFRLGSLRVFCVLFSVLMSFSAVYLNHHYVLDVLVGWTYGISGVLIADWWYGRKAGL